MDNLICKTQAHVRVSEANKLEKLRIRRKKRCLLKQFRGKRCKFEGSYKKSREMHQDDILKDDSP